MDDKALTEMLRLQMKEDEDNQQSQELRWAQERW
jgi:hypothetical protein